MHVAASNPLALSEADLDPVLVERERTVQTEKALEENATSAKPKPDAVIENNIIPGRMKKFLEEITLLGQKFVINPDLTVARSRERSRRRSRPASSASPSAKASRRRKKISPPKSPRPSPADPGRTPERHGKRPPDPRPGAFFIPHLPP